MEKYTSTLLRGTAASREKGKAENSLSPDHPLDNDIEFQRLFALSQRFGFISAREIALLVVLCQAGRTKPTIIT